ncbi:MAG: hypothetical protein Faunusvirus2_50 [Faunusvirus sp.]|jgi:ankyrin repeat protein|uniref:Uncharacterized protein n=1 Tax=Faunusvirus sp. TaxID=2487766 RepID=A0A3G4ZZU8_9VIRU|nr:MAG: hypothetical protein Faunusvirus2_50 [Faunusvirus sp.]
MTIAQDHAIEFIKRLHCGSETNCIEYIDKYNDFYNIVHDRWHSLMYAIWYKSNYEHNNNVITELIQRGANINFKSPSGKTPLSLACDYGCTDVAIILVKAGADFVDVIDTHIIFYNHQQVIQCIRNVYRERIISVINTGDNAIAISFKTTYVSGIINMISEFII